MKTVICLLFCILVGSSSAGTYRMVRQLGDNTWFGNGGQIPGFENFFNGFSNDPQQQFQQQQQQPQQQQLPAQQPNTNPVPDTNPAANVTPNPAALRRCLANCLTTQEYNPVCASDQMVYDNRAKLDCNIRCGANITFVKTGICNRPSRN